MAKGLTQVHPKRERTGTSRGHPLCGSREFVAQRQQWTVQVKLKRERLELSPVYSTALMHDDHKVGYVRLSSFSQKAASDMRRHISKLEVPPPPSSPPPHRSPLLERASNKERAVAMIWL